MDLKSMKVEEIPTLLHNREEKGLSTENVIEMCFTVMEKHPKPIEKCLAAVILSRIVQKGLGKRTSEFLKTHPKLPPRVHEVLNAAILRMECY